jgi:hypothetical protein
MYIIFCTLLFAMLPVTAAAQKITFDRTPPGALDPAEWTVAMTSEGGAPRWAIIRELSAPSAPQVLAQVSEDPTRGRFPLAVYQRAEFVNGRVSVLFHAVRGEIDQAAGLVWRYKDPDNYYIVRANALEDNIVLYKVENGKRISLAPVGMPGNTYGVKREVPAGQWLRLAVLFEGPKFQVLYEGNRVMTVEDTTFTGAGRVGLWTKADSVTWFDDFEVEPAP